MIRLLKIAAVAALCAGVLSGGGQAAEGDPWASGAVAVAQDTMRDISATLHSRLDAYRKVVEYYGSMPVGGTALSVGTEPAAVQTYAAPEAYGSTILALDYERYLNRFWVGGIGTLQDARERDNVEGWKYKGGGVMLGYDRAFGATMIGGSLSFVDGNFESKYADNHDSKIQQYSANIYATYSASNGFFGSVMGGYTLSDNNIDESDDTGDSIRADYRTHTLYAGGKLGYDIELRDTFTLSPSIGVDFFHSRSNSHKMTGYNGNGDIFRFRYGRMKNTVIEVPLDLKASVEIPMGGTKALGLMANVGYAYNLNDKAVHGGVRVNGGIQESVEGRRAGHHSWKAGAGARYRVDMWDFGVKYDYLMRSKHQAHRLTGQVGYSF